MNIDNYPAIEQVLSHVTRFPRHVLLDAEGLAKKAGSARSANIVSLGAASIYLEIDAQDLEDAVAEMFASKGEEIVQTNRRAFRIGRNAADAYRAGLGGLTCARCVSESTPSPEVLLSSEAGAAVCGNGRRASIG